MATLSALWERVSAAPETRRQADNTSTAAGKCRGVRTNALRERERSLFVKFVKLPEVSKGATPSTPPRRCRRDVPQWTNRRRFDGGVQKPTPPSRRSRVWRFCPACCDAHRLRNCSSPRPRVQNSSTQPSAASSRRLHANGLDRPLSLHDTALGFGAQFAKLDAAKASKAGDRRLSRGPLLWHVSACLIRTERHGTVSVLAAGFRG